MNAHPGPSWRRRTSTPLVPATAPRRQPLPSGQLRAMALAHLRAHPDLDFSPAEIANALSRPKSRGAIIRSCHLFTAYGLATRTQDRPQRYRATAPPHPPNDARTNAEAAQPRPSRQTSARRCHPDRDRSWPMVVRETPEAHVLSVRSIADLLGVVPYHLQALKRPL